MNTIATGGFNNKTAAGELTNLATASARQVELMIGPYRTGKTDWLINELVDYCRDNPFGGATILVPSQRYQTLLEARIHEVLKKRRGNAAGVMGLVGLEVGSFYRVCQNVLRRKGVGFRVIPDKVRPALIQRVMQKLDQEGQLTALKPIISFNGTHLSVLDLIDEFERAALSPEDVMLQLEQTSQSESRYMELAKIYRAYWQELDALGFIDERGLAFKTREVLAADGSAPLLGLLAVDGFDRFNSLQLQVLAGLSRHARQTKICFDYLCEAPPVQPKRARKKKAPKVIQLSIFATKEREGEELSGEVRTEKSLLDDEANSDFLWKETSYFELIKALGPHYKVLHPAQKKAKGAARQAVKFRAGDRFFEMEEIARRIKHYVVDEQARPAEILVVARSLRSYKAPIAAAFDAAGLSYHIDESINLMALPMVQFLSKLFKLAINNFKRRDVINCLRSPYFRRAVTGLEARDIERLDRLTLQLNLVEGLEQWRMLPSMNENPVSGEGSNANLINFFQKVTAPPSGRLSDFIKWAEDLIECCLELQFEEDNCDRFDNWEEQKSLIEFKRALAALMHEETILGEGWYSREAFLHRLDSLVERANIRKLPRCKNAITICGADLAPNRSFDYVFVAGLVEGEFPRRSGRAGFIGADEVARWAAFGINIQNPRFHPSFEPALFNSLVERARAQVVFSYPSFELNGDELLPSFFMTEGRASAADEITTVVPFRHALERPLSSRDALAGWLWHTADAEPAARLLYVPEIAETLERLGEPMLIAQSRSRGKAASMFNGYLSDHVRAGTVSVRLPEFWSASKLNDYGQCPFKYWVTHMLQCQPYEEPESGLPRRILGEAYHKAMELFYRSLKQRDLKLGVSDTDLCQAVFDESVDQAMGWLEKRPDVRLGEFWQYERIEILFRLRRFYQRELSRALRDKDGFRPYLLEAGFGFADEESAPALSIEHNGKKILVRGRIDRIDVAENELDNHRRVRVIDYKTGSSPISREDALRGRNIQLPLYAMAVQKAILPGSDVIAAAYLSVSSAEAIGTMAMGSAEKTISRDGDSITPIKVLVEGFVKQYVDGIAAGDFTVRPNGAAVCKKCPHAMICRVREIASGASEEEGA